MNGTISRVCTNCVGRLRLVWACTQPALRACSLVRRRCYRIAPTHVRGLHTTVQNFCRQRAAPAAPSLPLGQRFELGAWLAAGRSRERMREAKTEGKIKGAARIDLPSLSARGVGTAPRWRRWVLRRHAMPRGSNCCRVPLWTCCAMPRWSLCYGFA